VLLLANLLGNDIGIEQAQALARIFKEHPTLKSLCGNRGNETELDMRGKVTGPGDAIMLAAEVVNSKWLKTFTFSGYWCGESVKGIPVTMEASMTEANFSGKGLGISGAIMLASFLPKCTALEVLDLGSNELTDTDTDNGYGEMEQDFTGIIAVSNAIKCMERLASLNLTNNRIGGIWSYYDTDGVFDFTPEGLTAITDAVKDMTALSSLDLRQNDLGEVEPHRTNEIQRTCRSKGVVLQL
jgi:hypothetical protein